MPAVFRHFVGQALLNVRYCDITFIASDNTDIFLNQLIQFYSNNAANLHHLATHSTTCCPRKWRSCCDHRAATSLHPKR